MKKCSVLGVVFLVMAIGRVQAQTTAVQPSAQSATTTPGATAGHGAQQDVLNPPTKDDLLRGAYGPYRANNDLLFYHLDVRVDPAAKSIAGTNTVRFRMLADGKRIQLELTPQLNIDSIKLDEKALQYTREERTVWIDFPETLHKGQVYEIAFAYSGKHGETTLDYYALPDDLDKAKAQFSQVPEMLDAYEHYFGEYPFVKDGYKLVEVPYAGMEHQSAVAYGNHFENGYYGRDWTGVGISPKFDFIIIHESGHEWFGNSITAADPSDMWIHEGWTTYMEVLYVEYRWGKADGLRYVNGLKPKVHNERPIITPRGTNAEPPQDQYFKGALMINTLRSVIDDDAKWFADIHDFYQRFKYQNIMTEDVVSWWNERTGLNLTPFFDEYLRHAALPVLELHFDAAKSTMSYRWKADEEGFAMPVKVGDPQHWTLVTPVTKEWKSMPWTGSKDGFKVATDLYFVEVKSE